MANDPFLSLPIHAPQDRDAQGGYKYKHSLSAGLTPFQLNEQNFRIDPIDAQRFLRNLSSTCNEYNPNNIMAQNDRDDSAESAHSIMTSSSRGASPASTNSHISSNVVMAAVMNKRNKQKNDKPVEVLNGNGVVIARFRTQTECAKYLQATPEAVSYHCSKKNGGTCNGLVIRPCDHTDDIHFGLFAGAEEVRPKRRPQLKPETVAILKDWLLSPEHINNPYPNSDEMNMLMNKTGLDKAQLKHWFNNARKRILKPIVGKKKAQRQVVQEKRKAATERSMKSPAKKIKVESLTDTFGSSGAASSSNAPLSQFGMLFGSERAGAGAFNNTMSNEDSMAMGMASAMNPSSFGFNQGGAMAGMNDNPSDNSSVLARQAFQGSSFGENSFQPQPQQQQQMGPSPVVFKQQVASMAMKEATIAFKNMEDAYAMAKEIMNMISSSGSSTNIEEDPRVIEATARAKKLQNVALFKLKVSKRASEEAEKAFMMLQGSQRLP